MLVATNQPKPCRNTRQQGRSHKNSRRVPENSGGLSTKAEQRGRQDERGIHGDGFDGGNQKHRRPYKCKDAHGKDTVLLRENCERAARSPLSIGRQKRDAVRVNTAEPIPGPPRVENGGRRLCGIWVQDFRGVAPDQPGNDRALGIAILRGILGSNHTPRSRKVELLASVAGLPNP